MSTATASPREGRDLLEERLGGHRWLAAKDVLFRVYVIVICGALLGPLALIAAAAAVELAVRATGAPVPLGAEQQSAVVAVCATVAALPLLWRLRMASWLAPAGLETADVAWLVASPQPRASLLRPRLRRAMTRAAVVGGVLGAIVGVVVAELLGRSVVARGTAGAAAGVALGLVAQALAWWVLVRVRRARLALRAAPPVIIVAAAVGATGLLVPGVAWALAWSGPWGWAALMLAASPLAATAAAVLLATVAAATTAWALRQAGQPPAEELWRRAAVGTSLGAALFFFDVARAREAARDATDALRGPSRLRLPAPRRPRLAVVWRDATVAVRRPGALVGGLALAVTAGAGVSLGLGTRGGAASLAPPASPLLVLVPLSGLIVTTAARMLLAPLRSALAHPFGHLMLPWGNQRLLSHHLVFPTAALALGGLGGAGLAAAGVPAAETAWPSLDGLGTATALSALWVAVTTPPVSALTVAGALRPPPDPVESAQTATTQTGMIASAATRWLRQLPLLLAILPPTVLLPAAAIAATPTAVTGAVAITLGWGAVSSAAAWWWLRRRRMPWQ